MSSPARLNSQAKASKVRAASNAPVWLRAGFWACIAISIAVVLRRVAALVFPSRSAAPQLANLDAAFASHAALTFAHILPALAFVVLTPLVLLRTSRKSAWPEQALYPLGIVVGITAYAMSAFAVGGWVERTAVLFFNTWFLFALIRSWWLSRGGEQESKRRWLLRSIVVLLGIATTRPVMGVFFATSPITHLQVSQFFGIAFWIGFSINAIAVEIWLRTSRRRALNGDIASQS